MDLPAFFKENPNTAIAFSGGVDSAYLLYAAAKYGSKAKAYYVKSAFQPQFELDDAKRIASDLHIELHILKADVFSSKEISSNSKKRCYFCKKLIFSKILEAAKKDGFFTLLDGTNASDEAPDRPGMQAATELCVHSPLRECGLTKETIRHLSKEAGLFTWDKPAYACLATRIPTGTPITSEKLVHTEHAEDFLRSLGLSDFRVRSLGNAAKIQVPENQLGIVLAHRTDILQKLGNDYSDVLLDLATRG